MFRREARLGAQVAGMGRTAGFDVNRASRCDPRQVPFAEPASVSLILR